MTSFYGFVSVFHVVVFFRIMIMKMAAIKSAGSA